MNKSQLVDALADRLGDRKTAVTTVDALLQIVVDTVRAGESVSLAGFGVFESRARAARTGRNPRTGESVDVPATTVPAFRPGTGFRNAVAGEAGADDTTAPRRRAVRPATNGGGREVASTALAGAVDLADPATDGNASKGKGRKKPKASINGKDAKDGKDKKKGKKGKR